MRRESLTWTPSKSVVAPQLGRKVMWAQIIMGKETERARLAREIHVVRRRCCQYSLRLQLSSRCKSKSLQRYRLSLPS